MMNAKIKAQWEAELLSGDHLQGTGQLHYVESDGTEYKCCLGVACDMAYRAGKVTRVLGIGDGDGDGRRTYYYGDVRECAVLPREVMEYLETEGRNPHVNNTRLSVWNDGMLAVDDVGKVGGYEVQPQAFVDIAALIHEHM